MSCGFQVFKVGQEKILRFKCEDCTHCSSPESSEACLRGIIGALLEHPEAGELILPGPLDSIYSGESLLGLKQLALAFEKCSLLAAAKPSGCGRCWKERREELGRIVKLIPVNPRLALTELRGERAEAGKSGGGPACQKCREDFSKTLETMHKILEECLPPKGIGLKPPLLRPCFSGSRLSSNPPRGRLLESYQVCGAEVRIYQLPDQQHFYFLLPPELTLPPGKADLLRRVQEALLSKETSDPLPSKEQVRRSIERLILEFSAGDGATLEPGEVEGLGSILLRHTAGFGLLEVLLSDPWVQDVYADAPLGSSPVHLYHRNYDECLTNLYLTPMDAEPLVSKFRALSGRPFSETDPVLELEWGQTRITVVGRPLSPHGVSFSFRQHKSTPWTLAQFVAAGFLPPLAAALLSLAVDAQSSILITGSRGAGKTSLLGSLLLEIHPKSRILVVEDTPELPVERLRELGFKIQTLQTKSPLSTFQGGVSAEDALRTVLRMGESVLVLGEVRGPEARVLFEAMRIGAVGNSVLGTIHGSGSRDVLERIVHDLGISPNSFKCTDLIACAGPVRKKGTATKRRKLLQLTEVRKFPELELRDLLAYHPSRDSFVTSMERSEFLWGISRRWGVKPEELKRRLEVKAKIFETLVETSRELGNPKLLEADFVLKSNLKIRSLLEEESEEVFEEWHHWLLGAAHEE
jgi:type IV secretory pathway ATPase VirB11/archaellum biosynthesis ATPase